MRKTCYGKPVEDFKGWHTTVLYIIKNGVTDNDALLALAAFRNLIENAVFESKRPMIIRANVSAIGGANGLEIFKECFRDHIMYLDNTEILFAGRTTYSSSPIVTWRRFFPHATM